MLIIFKYSKKRYSFLNINNIYINGKEREEEK